MTFAKGDAGRVQEYRERLRQSLDIFWVRPSLPKFKCPRPDVFMKLQSSIHVRENLSQIAKQQGAMYQALEDRRSNDGVENCPPSTEYVSSGQRGRLEVLSATRYDGDIFNNARGNGNTLEVASNQISNVGSHNSTQMTSKTVQAITGASINVSVFVSDCPPHF